MKYKNNLLKKHLYLGIVVSFCMLFYFYYINNYIITFSFVIYLSILFMLVFTTRKEENYEFSSRVFSLAISFIFLVGIVFLNINRGEFFILLTYPIAVFSVRGYKEGIYWSIFFTICLIILYLVDEKLFSDIGFLFLLLSFWIISYLLYTYNYFEIKNFDELNKSQERKEQLLIQQSKLVNMGELVGAITHQWRQPLSEISSNILRIQVETEYKQIIDKEVLKESIDNTNRLLTYMSKVLDAFSSVYKNENRRDKFLLTKAIADSIVIYKGVVFGTQISFKYDENVNKSIYEIYGLKDEIVNIMIILLKNSQDAFIKRKVENRKISLKLNDTNEYLTLIYKDTAGGISLTPIEQIFEQSVTDKKDGLGIGLYIVKKIVEERYFGKIEVSNTKKGVKFILNFKKMIT